MGTTFDIGALRTKLGIRYNDRARGGDTPCGLCGKGCKEDEEQVHLHFVNGGMDDIIQYGDNSHDNDPGDMGCWPIGADCEKKLKLLMGAETWQQYAIVIDTVRRPPPATIEVNDSCTSYDKGGVEILRLRTIVSGIKLEMKTKMKLTRGISCYALAKQEFGLKGNKEKVYAAMVAILAEAESQAIVVDNRSPEKKAEEAEKSKQRKRAHLEVVK